MRNKMKKKYLNIFIITFLILISLGCEKYPLKTHLEKEELFSILRYEILTIGNKYIFAINNLFSENNESKIDDTFIEFQLLTKKINSLEKQKEINILNNSNKTLDKLNNEISDLKNKRKFISLKIEKEIQKIVKNQIKIEGINFKGLVFPPVLIKIFDPPLLLITSPRNVISREHEILLNPNMKNSRKNLIENKMLEEENLSAIILEIGGLATYPSMIKPNTNLERLFELAAHEWLHQYLIFYPLGRSIFENNKMTEINETLANIFGKEISKKICKNKLYKIYCENNDKNFTENPFDYNTFMQETRKNVEVLLKNNNIIEAEEYMENRRKELLEKGIFIRKINQAWFAFNGTYADSPTSISPVFSILKNIQENTDNLKNFIEILQNIDSYEELLQINPTNMEKNNYNY
tara:strand:- start:1350 stop:2573 length:1224 start_codon:yes stop_codon:yes gene_type:complete